MYYKSGASSEAYFYLGTGAVRYFSYMIVQFLGLSFLGCSLLFHILGFIGLLAFDAALREVTWYKARSVRLFATLIVLLPSVSFWSSGLGKDSVAFLSAGLTLWAALDMRRRWFLFAISVFMMFFVRPHMAGILVLSLAASYVFQRRIPLPRRLLLGTMALAASALLVPLGLEYAGVGEQTDAAELLQYVEVRQAQNLSGGSSVDIASMNTFMRLFTYMFRPLFFDASGIFGAAASIDNAVLLFLFIAGGWAALRRRLPASFDDHNRNFLWIYSFLAWLVLASVTANLGIALRQKWMFAPILIFLLISVVGRSSPSNRDARISFGYRYGES